MTRAATQKCCTLSTVFWHLVALAHFPRIIIIIIIIAISDCQYLTLGADTCWRCNCAAMLMSTLQKMLIFTVQHSNTSLACAQAHHLWKLTSRRMLEALLCWLRKGMEWSQRRPSSGTPMPSSSLEVLLRCLCGTFCYCDLYARIISHSALVLAVYMHI